MLEHWEVPRLGKLLRERSETNADAVSVLGSIADIRVTFIGFQKHLYEARASA